MKKHEILENIRIEKLIFGGSGLATAPDGRRIIISGGAIPEAVVDLRITKSKKNHLEAQILRTVQKSPLEQPIPDEWQLYGGCKWLPIPYDKQLEIKEQQIREAFYPLLKQICHAVAEGNGVEESLSKLSFEALDVSSPKVQEKGIPTGGQKNVEPTFHPIIASPESEHYRNKVEFSWGKYISDREGVHDEYRFGFHAPGQFDRIENCRYCVLADDEVNAIFQYIDTAMRSSGFMTYDPRDGDGFLRHLVVRKAKKTQEIMLMFSVNGYWTVENALANIPEAHTLTGSFLEATKTLMSSTIDLTRDFFTNLATRLQREFPHIASIFFLENTGRADIVQGNPVLIFGKPSIMEELLGYTFEIQPKSFFQVNTLGAERLYTLAIDSIANKGGTLLDLYAGTGTIGILLSKYFSQVYSVELVASASEDGKKNAERNGVSNVEFVNAKVEDFAQEFSASKKQADTIVLDPPRDGLHPSAIPHILSFGASEIIYVSCNPATLVRDLALLLKGYESTPANQPTSQYHLTDVTPVDMFPHTHHIETVVRLERI